MIIQFAGRLLCLFLCLHILSLGTDLQSRLVRTLFSGKSIQKESGKPLKADSATDPEPEEEGQSPEEPASDDLEDTKEFTTKNDLVFNPLLLARYLERPTASWIVAALHEVVFDVTPPPPKH